MCIKFIHLLYPLFGLLLNNGIILIKLNFQIYSINNSEIFRWHSMESYHFCAYLCQIWKKKSIKILSYTTRFMQLVIEKVQILSIIFQPTKKCRNAFQLWDVCGFRNMIDNHLYFQNPFIRHIKTNWMFFLLFSAIILNWFDWMDRFQILIFIKSFVLFP